MRAASMRRPSLATMVALPLEFVLGIALALLSAALLLWRRRSDGPAMLACVALIGIGLVLALAAPVEAVERILDDWSLLRPLGLLALALTVVVGFRFRDHRLAAALVLCGLIVGGHALGLFGGWSLSL